MADDSTYYVDVLRWLVAHPHQGGDGYLVKPPSIPMQQRRHGSRRRVAMCTQASCACVHGSAAIVSAAISTPATAPCANPASTAQRFGPFSGETHITRQFASTACFIATSAISNTWLCCSVMRRTRTLGPHCAARARRHSALPVAAEGWRLCRFRFCPRPCIELCLHNIALSPMGRLRHARTSHNDGSEA